MSHADAAIIAAVVLAALGLATGVLGQNDEDIAGPGKTVTCADGWESSSLGPGTCSGHGGIA